MPSFTAAWVMAVSAIPPFWLVLSIHANTSSRPGRKRRAPAGNAARRALTSARHGRATLRPARDRAEVAGDLAAGAHLGGLQRRGRRAAVVRAGDAPLPLRRAPHGAYEELQRRRRRGALPPPQRHARAASDGLRCVRPAGREQRDQDRPAPARG